MEPYFIVTITGDEEPAFWSEEHNDMHVRFDIPHVFATEALAEEEIADHLQSVREAVDEGHMDEETMDTRDDYSIVPISRENIYSVCRSVVIRSGAAAMLEFGKRIGLDILYCKECTESTPTIKPE